ncbi:MAG: HAMP domain-containing histidine kinase [Cyclobacteriaceae bacterium]
MKQFGLLALLTLSFCANADVIDSLKQELINSPDQAIEINLALAEKYSQIDLDSMLYFAQSARDRAADLEDMSSLVEAYNLIGVCFLYAEDYSSAEINIKEGLEVVRNKIDSSEISALLSNYASSFFYQERHVEALKIRYEVEKTLKEGPSNWRLSHYINMSAIFGESRLFSIEEEYLFQALEVAFQLEDQKAPYRIYDNLASLKIDQGQLDTALVLLKQVYVYSLENDIYNVPYILNQMADIYGKLDQKDSMEYYYREAIHVAEEFELGVSMADLQISRAYLSLINENLDSSLYFANIVHEYDSEQYEDDLNNLYWLVYDKKGNTDSAYAYLQRLYKPNNETDYQHAATLSRMHYMKQIMEEQQENQKLNVENEQAKKDNFLLITIVSITTIVAIVILLLLIYSYRISQERNHALMLKNQAMKKLETSFSINNKLQQMISHDFKGPLANIISLLELNTKLQNPDILNKALPSIMGQVNSLLHVFDSVQRWTMLQNDTLKIIPEEFEWNTAIQNTIDVVKPQATSKSIEINSEMVGNITLSTDRIIIETIARNLLNNAIKFSPKNSIIKVTAASEGATLTFSVIDQGVGIDQDTLKILNDEQRVTKKGTENEEGTGLGLAMIREFLVLLKGSMSISSEAEKGTRIEVRIPDIVAV